MHNPFAAPFHPSQVIGPFTEYEARTRCGFGVPETFRIRDFQGVRASHSTLWDVFQAGRCVRSCLGGEAEARAYIRTRLKSGNTERT